MITESDKTLCQKLDVIELKYIMIDEQALANNSNKSPKLVPIFVPVIRRDSIS